MSSASNQVTQKLRDRDYSAAFYEERYASGYMDEWPQEKKQRVFEVIQQLDLPAQGEALDFGCGNGVFTEVIRQALPDWTVFGTDLSRTAVSSAREQVPQCSFFDADDPEYRAKKFDFVFTHHVLEHVYDIDNVFEQLQGLMHSESAMLHVLPCGNPGSLGHTVSSLREDGIDAQCGNRFFFEDEGHIRRLTTQELSDICQPRGFSLCREFYSGPQHDAIEWVTSNSLGFIRMYADSSQAIDDSARRELDRIRRKLLLVGLCRVPARNFPRLWRTSGRSLSQWLRLILLAPLYPLSKWYETTLKSAARAEWKAQDHGRRGGEMFLFFRR